jgi:hypothetical protein
MGKYLFKNYPKIDYDFDGDGLELQKVTNIMMRTQIQKWIRNNSSLFYEYTLQDGDRADIIAHKYYDDANLYWVVLMMNDIADGRMDMGFDYQGYNNYLNSKYPGVTISVTGVTGTVKIGAEITGDISGAKGEIVDWNPTTKEISILETYRDFQTQETARSVLIEEGVKYVANITFGISKVGRLQATHHYEDTTNNVIVDRDQFFTLPTSERRQVTNGTYEEEQNQAKRTIRLLKKTYVPLVIEEIEKLMDPNSKVV